MMDSILKLVADVTHYVAMAEGATAELTDLYATAKEGLSSNDIALVRSKIDEMHGRIQANAEELDGLRDQFTGKPKK